MISLELIFTRILMFKQIIALIVLSIVIILTMSTVQHGLQC